MRKVYTLKIIEIFINNNGNSHYLKKTIQVKKYN